MLEIASELASGLADPEQVRTRYGLTEEEFDRLVAHPEFQRMLAKLRDEWLSVKNVSDRSLQRAAALLELLLPEMYRLALDPATPPNARVAVFGEVAKLVSARRRNEARVSDADDTSKVVVNINIGDKPVTIEAAAEHEN